MQQFVPAFILDRFAHHEQMGQFPAIVLGLDISSFTSLAEKLRPYRQAGAETLSNLLEAVFRPTIEQVHQNGGMIASFAGDALIALFPLKNDDNAALRAWKTAVFIQTLLSPENQRFQAPYGAISLQVKIGLSAGDVRWGIPGTDNNYTFYFRGAAIRACAHAQSLSTEEQIVVDAIACKSLNNIAHITPISDSVYHIARPLATTTAVNDTVNDDDNEMVSVLPSARRAELHPFVDDSILNMIQPAEFRHVCPVFIAFQTLPDPDRWHPFIAALIKTASRYGGVFGQLDFSDKGNIAILWFGAPISHEDDVRRAAQCLLDLQRQAHAVSWRAGLSFGLAWAGIRGAALRCEYSVIGHVVNTAARLTFKAGWNEIWLDQAAAHHLKNHYDLQQRGTHALRGQQTPHTLYKLIGGTSLNIMYRGELLGRNRELERLDEALRPLAENRFAGIVYLYGQAGMGKSRLAFEWRQQLGDQIQWLYCPAQDHIRQSLAPFRHHLRVAFQQAPTQSPAQNQVAFDLALEYTLERLQAIAAPRAATVCREIERTRPLLAALLNLSDKAVQFDPKLHFENTLQALTAYFQAQTLLRPVVVQLEDFHWCDQDSVRFLEHFLAQSDGYPLLILCTSRYREDGACPTLETEAATPQTALHLDRLSAETVRRLAQQLLGKAVGADVCQLLIEKSGGIPFYAEQLTLALQDQNLLLANDSDNDCRYHLAPQAAVHLPASLNALLIARLDRLPTPVKQVVQTASILGEQFTVPILVAILPTAALHLQEAGEKQIWDRVGENRYLFRHVLLREAAYHMQLQTQRQQLHQTAVDAYETIHADTLATYYHELAYHAHHAGDTGKELIYSLRAGSDAFEQYANEEALTYLQRVAQLCETIDDADAHKEALEKIGRILHRQGHYVATAETYKKLHHLVAGDVVLEVEAALLWAGALEAQGKNLESLAMVQTAAVRLQGISYTNEQQAQVLYQEAWLYFRMSQDVEVLTRADACLALLDINRPSVLLIQTLKLKGYVYLFAGQYNLARHWLQKARDAGKDPIYEREVSTILNALGEVARLQGDYEAALSICDQSMQLAQKLSMHSDYLLFSSNLGGAQVGAGLIDKAIITLEQVCQMMNPTWFNIPETYRFLAEAYLLTDRIDDALDIARKALRLAETGTSPNMQGGSWLILGRIAAASDKPIAINTQGTERDAAYCFGRSLEIYQMADMRRDVAWTLRLWARYNFVQGDADVGLARWQQAYGLFQELEMSLQLQEMDRLLPE